MVGHDLPEVLLLAKEDSGCLEQTKTNLLLTQQENVGCISWGEGCDNLLSGCINKTGEREGRREAEREEGRKEERREANCPEIISYSPAWTGAGVALWAAEIV